MRHVLLFSVFFICFWSCTPVADPSWPEIKQEAKPGTRWWWLGSAVDSTGLTANMEDLAQAGFGSVEITPIYGINGAEHRHIDYLTPRWMNMYRHVVAEGKRLGINIDMSNGTGWPFGGPTVSIKDAASKVIFQKYPAKGGTLLKKKLVPDDSKQEPFATIASVMAFSGNRKVDLTEKLSGNLLSWNVPEGDWTIWVVFNGRTLQEVKRAAPGGEGWVVNHLSKDALSRYLKRFDDAFSSSKAPWPNSFFNDSYEVYNANWTDNFFDVFEKQCGYRLQDYIPELNREGDLETCARIVCDYRQVMADLLMANFTIPWREWVHSHGATIRNQSHGSPGNLIDFYAEVDIPECESYGTRIFDIPGLRIDEEIKATDSSPVSMKYASSAAHITNKPFVSSETFTWLTEHFRTSLSQMKPEIDLMFSTGVNHMYYHGTPYSPRDVAWPGWLFYASVTMNANNPIFRDAKGINEYITRTQSFLQYGQPDNDFLLYLPVYDIWQKEGGLHLLFDIHKMQRVMPDFFDIVTNILEFGYDVDYISDKHLAQTTVKDKKISTTGGVEYKAVIIPDVEYIPAETLKNILLMAEEGATVVFTGRFPKDVPGFSKLEERREDLKSALSSLPANTMFKEFDSMTFGKGKILFGKDRRQLLEATSAKAEMLSAKHEMRIIRRKHDNGHLYFMALLKNKPLDDWVKLSVDANSAIIFNTLTGESGKANLRRREGQTEVYLQFEPGQSLILKTFTKQKTDLPEYPFYQKGDPKPLVGDWTFRFTEGMPAIEGDFSMKGSPVSWTELSHDSVSVHAGTGRYSIRFEHNGQADEWLLDPGILCESARVYVNGHDAGIVWSIPYMLKVGKWLRQGENVLEIDVTNLPANRIRDYDRRTVPWRKFKNINMGIYEKTSEFDQWKISPSGLVGEVNIVPLYKIKSNKK